MTIPITSHTAKRIHVSVARLIIMASEITIPRMGTTGTHGVLKGRGSSGLRFRKTHTPAHTITNASNVPMETISSSTLMGSDAARTATKKPTVSDEIHGVRKR